MADKLHNVVLARVAETPRSRPQPQDLEPATPVDVTAISYDRSFDPPGLILPPLCHPHIHLDKAYLFTSNNHYHNHSHPDYSDLVPCNGSFKEALISTREAITRFTEEDLYLRGAQLLATSLRHGVTSLRAFVEFDAPYNLVPIQVALKLKQQFSHLLELQICLFAQEAWSQARHPELFAEKDNAWRKLLDSHEAGDLPAIGCTPYVEADRQDAEHIVKSFIGLAIEYKRHVDFHLDYNLDAVPTNTVESSDDRPLLYTVIEELIAQKWTTKNPGKTVVIGHCTRLTQYSHENLLNISEQIHSHALPIHFVGLPTSDLYMMGRQPNQPPSSTSSSSSPSSSHPQATPPHHKPRGTMQIPSLIKDYNLNGCLGVNNLGNAFTPFGDGDPLQLASWGVGLYHAGGGEEDAKLLYGCVSWRARVAIFGADSAEHTTEAKGEVGEEGDDERKGMMRRTPIPALLVRNEKDVQVPGKKMADGSTGEDICIPARVRLSYKDVVWDPPASALRSIVR